MSSLFCLGNATQPRGFIRTSMRLFRLAPRVHPKRWDGCVRVIGNACDAGIPFCPFIHDVGSCWPEQVTETMQPSQQQAQLSIFLPLHTVFHVIGLEPIATPPLPFLAAPPPQTPGFTDRGFASPRWSAPGDLREPGRPSGLCLFASTSAISFPLQFASAAVVSAVQVVPST